MKRIQVLLGVCLVMVPLTASAQNNSAANAVGYKAGEGWINVNVGAAPNNQRWYAYQVVQGRSYCVEGVSEATPTLDYDGETTVFRNNGTTVVGSSDDAFTEPDMGTFNPGRVCYISDESTVHYARVGNFGLDPTVVRSYRWRVEDTTLFCPWFFSGNGFEAFILIRNSAATAVKVTVRLRNTAGVIVGTPQTATVPANASFNLQVSAASPSGFGLATANGSVEIAYGSPIPFNTLPQDGLWSAGAPGTVTANVTSLSFGQGVSFDTPANPRQDWRN
jgi:hypothetical protein